MNSLQIISPVAAFVFAFLIIPVLRKIALFIHLVDKPNARKVHNGAVPLIGGISIYLATTLALGLTIPFELRLLTLKNFFLTISLLLLMGVIDDKLNLRATLKLSIQLILAHFIYQEGIMIESLHGFLGIFEIEGWIRYSLTIIVITGVVNAFNLMDGIDGLAAGLAIVGFSVFAVLAYISGQSMLLLIFLTYIGALLAFLRFNFSKNQKIFMGDAGSLIIGFIMVVSGMKLIQVAQNTSYVFEVYIGVFAILLVPVFDSLRVFRKRIKSGKSPFSADKTHLHHLFLALGIRHKMASLGILLLVVSILGLGYFFLKIEGITFAIAGMLMFFVVISALLQFSNTIAYWRARILEMEDPKSFDNS